MIPARKVPLFNLVLRRWLGAVLRRRFHNVYLLGVENLRALDDLQPVLGCVNHTNWWDGFVLYVLSHRLLKHDIYLAMEEKNLRRYPFFTWMGVFGVDLSRPGAALPGLRYALSLLRATAPVPRLLWIFVQGRLLDPRKPIEAKPGASFLAARAGAQILPLVLRYEWLLESRPSVFVQIGAPLSCNVSSEVIAATMNTLFARVDSALDLATLATHETLFPARMSMNKRWDYFRHWLGRRRETFEPQNR